MTTTGSTRPQKGRCRLRVVADVAAVAMVATGAVLVGISVSQHQHYDHAIAAQAARKAQVDQAALAEAERFRAERSTATATREAHPATASSTGVRGSKAAGHNPRAAAVVFSGDHHGAARPARPQSPRTRPRPAVAEPRTVSEIHGLGATLVIPSLQVRAPVVATGAVDGSMTIPADVHTVGWYDGVDTLGGRTISDPTPWPGQPGVSLLAGHINWVGQGPGALYYIGQLVPGDPVEVIGSNGVATHWRVSQPPITVAKADLPADLFVNTGPPKLALVTCGGPYDPATGHYLDNVIVWATLAR